MKRYMGRALGIILSAAVTVTGMPVTGYAAADIQTGYEVVAEGASGIEGIIEEIPAEEYASKTEVAGADAVVSDGSESVTLNEGDSEVIDVSENVSDNETSEEEMIIPDNDGASESIWEEAGAGDNSQNETDSVESLGAGSNFDRYLGNQAAEAEGVTPVSFNSQGNVKGMLYTISNSTSLYLYIWSEGGTNIDTQLYRTTFEAYRNSITDIIFEEGIENISVESAFSEIPGLRNVRFPSTLQTIGENCFYMDQQLISVTFSGNDLYEIGDRAFYGCGMTVISLPASVADNAIIGSEAFAYTKLSSVAITTGFKVIDEAAFYMCANLKTIEIPLTVTRIGYSAIDSNYIQKVYYEGTDIQWGKLVDVFAGNEGWNPSKVVFGIDGVTGITIDQDYIMRYSDDLPKSGENVSITVTLSPAKAMNKYVSVSVKPIGGASPVTIYTTRREADERGRCIFVVSIKQNGVADVIFTSEDNPKLQAVCKVIVKSKEKAETPRIDSIVGGETSAKAVAIEMKDDERHSLASPTSNSQVFFSTVLNSNTSQTANTSWRKTGLFTDPDDEGFVHISSAYSGKALEVTDAITGKDLYDLYYKNLSKAAQDKSKIPATFYVYAIAIIAGDSTANKTSMSSIAFYKVTYSETVIDKYGDIIESDRKYYDDPSTGIYNPKGVWIPLSQREDESLIYTGNRITIPDMRVYYGTELLREGYDYTLSYANNIDAAERGVEKAPKVTVSLIGNYKGSKNFDFHIRPRSISDVDSIDRVTLVQSPYSQTPQLHVNMNGIPLNEGVDYHSRYRAHSDDEYPFTTNAIPGNALGYFDVMITGSGNYTGTYIQSNVVNVVLDAIDINQVSVTKIPVQYINDPAVQLGTYGTGVVLSYMDKPVVTYQKEIVPSNAYSLGYERNKAAGTGYLKIIANPDYSYQIGEGDNKVTVRFVGTKYVPFTIKGIPISKVSIKDLTGKEFTNANEREYTGMEIAPEARLTYNNESYTLSEDEYDIVYSNNIKAGKAKITVTGRGPFYGTTTRTFTITKKPLESCNITMNSEYDYSSAGIKPEVSVKIGDVELKENVDYSLSYPKKAKAGSYILTIRPKGSLNGKKETRNYSIRSISIEDCVVVVSDKVAGSKGSAYMQKPVVYDTNGVKLKSGTDYEKTFIYTYTNDTPYYPDAPDKMVKRGGKPVVLVKGSEVDKNDIIPGGVSISITITGKGNYAGNKPTQPSTVTEEFRVTSKKIKALQFSVKGEYVYSGKRFTPGKDDIEVKGVSVVDTSRLYDIIGYGDNINAGTGMIFVRGRGDYGGTTVVKFKILKK